MTEDQEEFGATLRADMKAHPEEWMWLWEKVLRLPNGDPVPPDRIRQFWGIV